MTTSNCTKIFLFQVLSEQWGRLNTFTDHLQSMKLISLESLQLRPPTEDGLVVQYSRKGPNTSRRCTLLPKVSIHCNNVGWSYIKIYPITKCTITSELRSVSGNIVHPPQRRQALMLTQDRPYTKSRSLSQKRHGLQFLQPRSRRIARIIQK